MKYFVGGKFCDLQANHENIELYSTLLFASLYATTVNSSHMFIRTYLPLSFVHRINYVHRMALFRMCTQIKEQTCAFMKGFHSIISTSLIQCFSPQELQKLISGDQVEIDVDDLRYVRMLN